MIAKFNLHIIEKLSKRLQNRKICFNIQIDYNECEK